MTDNDDRASIDPALFTIASLDDEIRADRQCTELLKTFAAKLVADHAMDPRDAGRLAHGADPFLRDFLIADRRESPFAPAPGRVRQYAGHFYIVHALEPNRSELADMLAGIAAFYRFSHEQGWCSDATLRAVEQECTGLDAYARRIENFWELEGDGFLAWRDELPIR